MLTLIENFRSDNENEDKDDFVCLVIVCMHVCLWHLTQAGNSLSATHWQRNFEEKLSSREGDLQTWVLYFQLIKNHREVFFVKFVINTQHYCGRDANFFFEIKQEKNKVGKECETGCFQSKVTNYVRAEMRTKAKYQSSRGRNSYSSFALVLGSKALQ